MKKFVSCLIVFCLFLTVCFAEDVSVSVEEHIPFPENWKTLTEDEINLKLLNILTGISTQKGLQYISRLAGYKPKTLFEDSYCIGNIEDRKSRIDDPVFDTLVSEYRLFAYQKDNRFGGNTYVIDYSVSEDGVELTITNHTPMRFAGVSCVKPECLTMKLKAEHNGEDFVVSGSAFVPDQKAKINFLFYTVDLESSFDRRITALKNWFIDQLNNF